MPPVLRLCLSRDDSCITSLRSTEPGPTQRALPGALNMRLSPPGDQSYLSPSVDAITLPKGMISMIWEKRTGYVSISAYDSSKFIPDEVSTNALIRGHIAPTKYSSANPVLGLKLPEKLITVPPVDRKHLEIKSSMIHDSASIKAVALSRTLKKTKSQFLSIP